MLTHMRAAHPCAFGVIPHFVRKDAFKDVDFFTAPMAMRREMRTGFQNYAAGEPKDLAQRRGETAQPLYQRKIAPCRGYRIDAVSQI